MRSFGWLLLTISTPHVQRSCRRALLRCALIAYAFGLAGLLVTCAALDKDEPLPALGFLGSVGEVLFLCAGILMILGPVLCCISIGRHAARHRLRADRPLIRIK